MATKIEDWEVTDVKRVPATYSDKIDLVSFTVSYRNDALERLSDIPFHRGITQQELLQWCADDETSALTK